MPGAESGAERAVEPGPGGAARPAAGPVGPPVDDGVPPTPPARSGARRLMPLFGAVAVLVLGLDQASKALAVAHLTEGDPVRVLGPVLRLDLTRNGGAAFSTGTSATWVFTLIALAVVVVVIRVARQLGSRGWAVALGLMLGGACGNLSDRLFRAPGVGRGHVVDFLELPHWPIFNVADSAVVSAGALIVLLTLLGIGLGGRPPAHSAGRPPGHEAPGGGADG